MADVNRQIVSIEILHLDEMGYGPTGEHSRGKWRAECIEYFLRGKEVFVEWQNSWLGSVKELNQHAPYSYIAEYVDGTRTTFILDHYLRHSLDFAGLTVDEEKNFEYYQFLQPAIFNNARFTKDVHFSGAVFNEDAEFSYTTFSRESAFLGTSFLKSSQFQNARFGWSTIFLSAIFKEGTNFDNSIFN